MRTRGALTHTYDSNNYWFHKKKTTINRGKKNTQNQRHFWWCHCDTTIESVRTCVCSHTFLRAINAAAICWQPKISPLAFFVSNFFLFLLAFFWWISYYMRIYSVTPSHIGLCVFFSLASFTLLILSVLDRVAITFHSYTIFECRIRHTIITFIFFIWTYKNVFVCLYGFCWFIVSVCGVMMRCSIEILHLFLCFRFSFFFGGHILFLIYFDLFRNMIQLHPKGDFISSHFFLEYLCDKFWLLLWLMLLFFFGKISQSLAIFATRISIRMNHIFDNGHV